MTETTSSNHSLSFFSRAHDSFLKASKDNHTEVFIKIGEHGIRLVFAGDALIPYFLPALKHLECSTEVDAELTVYLWDALSTGISMPAGEWEDGDFWRHGTINKYSSKEVKTTYNIDSGVFSIYNYESREAIFWVRNPMALPLYETAAPLRNILYWWGQDYGLQFAHAAVVGTKDGGVLLVGKGGSGKSTSALLSLNHPDMVYLGDDYLFVGTRDDGTHCAYSIYNSAKLHTSHSQLFPELLKHAANREDQGDEKRVFFVNGFRKEKLQNSIDLKAIVLPKVTGKVETSYAKSASSHAFRALVPSSIFQLPEANRERTFQIFGRIVRDVPAYALYAGIEFSDIPKALVNIIKESAHVR